MRNLLVSRPAGSWLWLLAARLWRRSNALKVLCLIGCSLLTHFATYAQSIVPPTDFKTWDWEIPPYGTPGGSTFSDAYRRTWRGNIRAGGVNEVDMGAPWNGTNSDALDLISTNADYKKEKGWQLVRFDFGGLKAVTVPYFILYHRLTGVLRIYAYIADNSGAYTGSVVTLSHSSNNGAFSGHSAATLSTASATTANGLLVAPDKYRTNSADTYGQEQMTYVSFLATKSGWTMAQFTLGFDPSINNAAYQLNKYQVQILGLVSSTVDLKGAFEFETNKKGKDFSYGGAPITPTKSATVSDGQEFVVGTQKFLGSLSTVSDQVKNIATKADKFSQIAAKTKVVEDVKNVAETAAKASSALSKIANVAAKVGEAASIFGGVFSLAGTVIGFFTDDAASPATSFVPTVSKGTITLSGTITTKQALHTFMLLTPGTQHFLNNSGSTQTPEDSRSQLAFNDCPTGIFNIQTTPVVETVKYNQWDQERVYNSNTAPGTGEMRRLISISNYVLRNDIKPTVNASSGLEIQSVRYALAYRVKLSEFQSSRIDSYDDEQRIIVPEGYNGWQDRKWNFLYGRVASGEAVLYPYDAGKEADHSDAQVIMQTPFASCYNGVYGIAVPSNLGKPYLRLIATLHVKGTPADSPPVYYAQDYAVEEVNSQSPPPTETRPLNAVPWFQVQYDATYPRPTSVYAPDIVKTGTLTYSNNNFGALGEVAFSSLLFDTNSSVTLQDVQQGAKPIVFQASRSVGFAGNLAIPTGIEAAISTDPAPLYPSGYYTCSNSQLQFNEVNIPCYQNDKALRQSTALATKDSESVGLATLTLAPNPALGSTVAQLTVAADESIQQVDVLNVSGQVLWTKSYKNLHELNETLPLNTFHAGVYIVRATTSNRVYTSKLAVQ